MVAVARIARAAINPASIATAAYSGVTRWRFRRCGPGLRLRLTTSIRGHENIEIGMNFVSMGQLYLYAENGSLKIGDNCSVNTNVQLGASSGSILLGDNVIIGPNVVVRAANHGIRRGLTMRDQPWVGGEISIESDVWIGSNAVVTTDVRIGRGTVVAAGAVVTHSTEAYSIVAGVPARKIGERT
jgi:galactoside O-acetyltransferase